MAAIDKIYVDSYEKYEEFKNWCEKQPLFTDKYGVKESMTSYLFTYWDKENWTSHPIASFPYYIDAYVIRNCPFDYIQDELMLRYGYKNQETINEAYETVMKRNGEKGKEGEYYWWLTKDDFEIVDGVITFPQNEDSDYMKIKRGEMLTSPFTENEYEVGKHFKCTKHPLYYYNKPFKCKNWWVQLITPNGIGYMTYHKKHNSWDFNDEYVISDWGSNTAHVGTIKALKRLMIKWKLPIGTIVRATGRYLSDTYEFKITK
jgi:hypothetical protein